MKKYFDQSDHEAVTRRIEKMRERLDEALFSTESLLATARLAVNEETSQNHGWIPDPSLSTVENIIRSEAA